MEPLSERCYPSNFFDPFGDEDCYASCHECGEVKDVCDMKHETSGGQDFYYCQDCQLIRLEGEDG